MFITPPESANHRIPVISTNSLELPFHLTKPASIYLTAENPCYIHYPRVPALVSRSSSTQPNIFVLLATL